MGNTRKANLARVANKRQKVVLAAFDAEHRSELVYPRLELRLGGKRYGCKRRYEAGRKVLDRRADRGKRKEELHREMSSYSAP